MAIMRHKIQLTSEEKFSLRHISVEENSIRFLWNDIPNFGSELAISWYIRVLKFENEIFNRTSCQSCQFRIDGIYCENGFEIRRF